VPVVRFSGRALDDLERIFDFLTEHDPAVASRAGDAIVDATSVLQQHPMIGRAVQGNLRELVISQGATGYVALYRFVQTANRIDVLAIRHQREAGFL
jgi:plasmid stabilization system protein ParE